MKRIFAILLIVLAHFGATKAIIVQKVTLKNGSVLNGYIQQQDGSGRLTFHTDNATIYVSSSITNVYDRKIKVASLDNKWKEWAKKNDAFEIMGDSTLLLNDVTFKPSAEDLIDSVVLYTKGTIGFEAYLKESLHQVSNVKVLERGVKVKYLELTPNVYAFSWSDIESIKAERRPKTALSGIDRIYELRNGKTYEGQYAEETDQMLSLYMKDGFVQSFKIDDVIKYTFKPVNPNQDIMEQSELIDIIKTRNGGIVRGLIIEQNYASQKDSENYFLIQTESGAISSIKVSDILELRKEENPKYAPQTDVVLNNDEVMINRMEAQAVNVKEQGDLLQLEATNKKTTLNKGKNGVTQIIVEYKANDMANMESFQLVKLTKAKIKKKTIYCFSYKDLVNSSLRAANIEISVNKTTKAVYKIGGTGNFVLYDAKNKRAIPFTIAE